MSKTFISFFFVFSFLLGGCTNSVPSEISVPTLVPSPIPTQLVGNDADEHGCIGSAGYSWCEFSQKCVRPWEEPCTAASPAPTVDETSIIKTAIKKAIVAKHGSSANSLIITVSKIVDDFSSGGASVPGEGGGMWFAAKADGQWQLVWDGNGIILCQDLASYPDFPSSLIPECYDSQTEKLKVR
ncbi:MAG: hypothetical protein WC686_04825 [Candidatus Shapirobacteria bacterium]|jgi:hypothetical protein